MQTIAIKEVDNLTQRAGEALDALLAHRAGSPRLLLCSGGAVLRLLAGIRPTSLDQELTVSVLDERFTLEETDRNFPQVASSELAARSKDLGVTWFDPDPLPMESPQTCAWRFEAFLRAWRKEHPDGAVIATMGLGADGHTAGIFPFPEDPRGFVSVFDDDSQWVVGYHAGVQKHVLPDRVTVTLPFLRTQVDAAVLWVVGEDKAAALGRILAPGGSVAETPGRIVLEMPHVLLYTDRLPTP